MLIKSNKSRLKVMKVYLYINCVIILFWWPLSHWFYPDLYHQLLGFSPGSYQDSMVKVIGTCGFFPVMLLFASAKDPLRNKDMIITLIILSFLIAVTFLYLIVRADFPIRELLNVCLSLFTMIFLLQVYPWKLREGLVQ